MKVYDTIEGEALKLIQNSEIFFIAPLSQSGSDGQDSRGYTDVRPMRPFDQLRVTGPRQVMYLESGGGEVLGHFRDNGRVCLLFCAVSGEPQIVRLYGRGVVHSVASPKFSEVAAAHFSGVPIVRPVLCRSIVQIDIDRVTHSCGYDVPSMTEDAETAQRDTPPAE
eukprot:TRINITY_DN5621_c0_g3_i1.p1 TRINITY_DN5621_c0_g3~~TRINITY_DN5621_c0_g3_i1.p1  ORF type:complete len:189 (+),score=48.58 TRINITY_DN5621_c0_g3_i1:70-567(+)